MPGLETAASNAYVVNLSTLFGRALVAAGGFGLEVLRDDIVPRGRGA
jgi:hypothetical protein